MQVRSPFRSNDPYGTWLMLEKIRDIFLKYPPCGGDPEGCPSKEGDRISGFISNPKEYPIYTWKPKWAPAVLIGKGLVLGGSPSNIEVIWVPGKYMTITHWSDHFRDPLTSKWEVPTDTFGPFRKAHGFDRRCPWHSTSEELKLDKLRRKTIPGSIHYWLARLVGNEGPSTGLLLGILGMKLPENSLRVGPARLYWLINRDP